jgi:hypothetical protein
MGQEEKGHEVNLWYPLGHQKFATSYPPVTESMPALLPPGCEKSQKPWPHFPIKWRLGLPWKATFL